MGKKRSLTDGDCKGQNKKVRLSDCEFSDKPVKKRAKKSIHKHKSKHKRKKRRKKYSESSSSEESSSSDSSSSSSTSSTDSEKKKKRRAKKKKGRREKSKESKNNAGNVKESAVCVEEPCIGPLPPENLSEKARSMAPMTKEEWEKRQSVVRRVYDEETGRHRLIKGDGEVLEEIVSRDRHKEINRQATKGDGSFFETSIQNKIKQTK